MVVAIIGTIIIALLFLLVIIHELRAKKAGKSSFNGCDCKHAKGQDLVKAYKALKEKEKQN